MPELSIEDVQDYPRPPALEPVGVRLRAMLGGQVVAQTSHGMRVLETHHAPTYYFPPDDVLPSALTPAPGRSFCEWKGQAQYFDVMSDGVVSHKAAWGYPEPTARFSAIKDFVAFYPERMEACFVGEELVTAQPGTFYGGWVTSNLRGIVKGAPGTEAW